MTAIPQYTSQSYYEKLKEFLESEGYFNVRILPDGVVCNYRYLFTTGLMLEPDFDSPATLGRLCYEDHALAVLACAGMTSIYDEPLPGWTADKRFGRKV